MSINGVTMATVILMFVCYIYIILVIGKDMFLNSNKTKKEQQQALIKKYIPFCMVVALGFIAIHFLITPLVVEILK